MEGKHFARTYEDAVKFGRMLRQFEQDDGPTHVLRVKFSEDADVRCYDDHADRIGPGYLATTEALDQIVSVEDCGLLPLEEG